MKNSNLLEERMCGPVIEPSRSFDGPLPHSKTLAGLVLVAVAAFIKVVAAPDPISGSSQGYSLTANQTTVAVGSPLTIRWQAPTDSSPSDWIGLYIIGSPDESQVWWAYTKGLASGTITFT